MGLGGSARREFVRSRFVIDTVILPMPITADDNDVVLGAELANLRPFVSPIGIGVIVFLVFPIGTDNRGRCK